MFAWLFRRPESELSRKAYEEAYQAYQATCLRGDTRAQHDALLTLRNAMTARLKAAA